MRKLRGTTYIGIIADELSFWHVEERYENPDVEVISAARMGLLTTRGMLLMASSPYAKRGLLWETYNKHFGPGGSPAVLVAKGTTAALNPTIPADEIAREMERDPVRNKAELLAEFRDDIANFVTIETIEACVGNHVELAAERDREYKLFADAAGGSGDDSFACAVAHRDAEMTVIDGSWEWPPPFSPSAAIAEIADIARRYHVSKIIGDKFGGGFPSDGFQKHSLSYEATKLTKSDLYRDLVPMLNSRRILLPRNTKMINQAAGLERTVAHSGKDTIDHGPGGHDDLINVVAGAASLAFTHRSLFGSDATWLDDHHDVNEESGNLAYVRWLQSEQKWLEANRPEECRCWRCIKYR